MKTKKVTKRSSNGKKKSQYNSVLLAVIISALVFGTFGYHLAKNSSDNVRNKFAAISPTPVILENEDGSRKYIARVLPVIFSHSSQLRIDESSNPDRSVNIEFDYPGYGHRFLRIQEQLGPEFSKLKNLKVGKSYRDNTITEIDSTYTRLEDRDIGGQQALVYERKHGWEMPGPIRDYYVPYDDGYLNIRVTYSNVESPDPGIPAESFDYITEFEYILSTFEFAK